MNTVSTDHTPDSAYTINDYKSQIKPVWCPGCGDYGVLASLFKALTELQLPPENVAFVSGIGCSSRIPAYTSLYGFHSIHGRALPVATGLKAARPDLTVLVAGGDGDGFSIGGNHFIHACRRNIDMTYIVMDNAVYGMTKGQASPTTAPDWTGSKLTPEGTGVAEIRPLEIALSAGANFIARAFAGHPKEVSRLICEGIRAPGFSLIQILSPCVTFRPEQMNYKDSVHMEWEQPVSDRKEAFMRLLDDDGMSTGILYQGHNRQFHPTPDQTLSLDDLEKRFAL